MAARRVRTCRAERRIPDPARTLALAHFPIRSPDQFVAKVVIGWLSRWLSADRSEHHSPEWRRWFERMAAEHAELRIEVEWLRRKAREVDRLDRRLRRMVRRVAVLAALCAAVAVALVLALRS